jgi:hypothetical protein
VAASREEKVRDKNKKIIIASNNNMKPRFSYDFYCHIYFLGIILMTQREKKNNFKSKTFLVCGSCLWSASFFKIGLRIDKYPLVTIEQSNDANFTCVNIDIM